MISKEGLKIIHKLLYQYNKVFVVSIHKTLAQSGRSPYKFNKLFQNTLSAEAYPNFR
jgi:hypothetical protein